MHREIQKYCYPRNTKTTCHILEVPIVLVFTKRRWVEVCAFSSPLSGGEGSTALYMFKSNTGLAFRSDTIHKFMFHFWCDSQNQICCHYGGLPHLLFLPFLVFAWLSCCLTMCREQTDTIILHNPTVGIIRHKVF